MKRAYYTVDEVTFSRGVLKVRLSSLHEGPPDGFVGLPLMKTAESQSYSVTFHHVGRFRVLPEAWNELKEPIVPLDVCVFCQPNSDYLVSNRETAVMFADHVPHGAVINHYVVHGADYVVDVLGATPPEVQRLTSSSE
jgi:hypothetical protein